MSDSLFSATGAQNTVLEQSTGHAAHWVETTDWFEENLRAELTDTTDFNPSSPSDHDAGIPSEPIRGSWHRLNGSNWSVNLTELIDPTIFYYSSRLELLRAELHVVSRSVEGLTRDDLNYLLNSTFFFELHGAKASMIDFDLNLITGTVAGYPPIDEGDRLRVPITLLRPEIDRPLNLAECRYAGSKIEFRTAETIPEHLDLEFELQLGQPVADHRPDPFALGPVRIFHTLDYQRSTGSGSGGWYELHFNHIGQFLVISGVGLPSLETVMIRGFTVERGGQRNRFGMPEYYCSPSTPIELDFFEVELLGFSEYIIPLSPRLDTFDRLQEYLRRPLQGEAGINFSRQEKVEVYLGFAEPGVDHEVTITLGYLCSRKTGGGGMGNMFSS